jgi:hypothetical protein
MSKLTIVFAAPLLGISLGLFAQQPAKDTAKQAKAAPPRPDPLFFQMDWTPKINEHLAIAQSSVSNPNLELKLYGSGKDMDTVAENGGPMHVWTGNCMTPCGLAFRDKNNYADLTGLARIKWNVKVSGFHKIHPVLRLADGSYLIGDEADGSMVDFKDIEFWIKDVRWLKLDAEHLAPKGDFFVPNPDLSRVDEIGFVDLMVGAGHGPGAYSDVGKIEVYGKTIKRDTTVTSSR